MAADPFSPTFCVTRARSDPLLKPVFLLKEEPRGDQELLEFQERVDRLLLFIEMRAIAYHQSLDLVDQLNDGNIAQQINELHQVAHQALQLRFRPTVEWFRWVERKGLVEDVRLSGRLQALDEKLLRFAQSSAVHRHEYFDTPPEAIVYKVIAIHSHASEADTEEDYLRLFNRAIQQNSDIRTWCDDIRGNKACPAVIACDWRSGIVAASNPVKWPSENANHHAGCYKERNIRHDNMRSEVKEYLEPVQKALDAAQQKEGYPLSGLSYGMPQPPTRIHAVRFYMERIQQCRRCATAFPGTDMAANDNEWREKAMGNYDNCAEAALWSYMLKFYKIGEEKPEKSVEDQGFQLIPKKMKRLANKFRSKR